MHIGPRHLCLIAAGLIGGTFALAQGLQPDARMTADAHPLFAVAVIKPHNPDSTHQGLDIESNRVGISDYSLSKLVCFAYAVNSHQIVNAPDWVSKDHYDIQGKPDISGEPTVAQVRDMVQKLLIDRYGLQLHRERRELPVYALQVSKGAPKLAPAADPSAKAEEHASGHNLETTRTYTSSSMQDFILVEQFFVDRPIVDQTGLTGRYDFKLNYTYDEMHNTDPDAPPGMFTAIQQELGLKLQPTKAMTDVLVLDGVHLPSEN
jgi:uncharacterized protein (TIGR03435 family)